MTRIISLLFLGFLMGCTTESVVVNNQDQVPTRTVESNSRMKTFDVVPKRRQVSRSNQDIAQEILDLAFYLESGRRVEKFTRFEGPITVGFTNAPPSFARTDLKKLVTRLRSEAGIPISIVPDGQKANISVDLVNGAKMRALVPSAACFIVPGASTFSELLRKQRDVSTDWSQLETRTQVVVVVPRNAAPQELRDCLHEEIAQALGPLNDLYRLADSVYNDDNFHLVLTPFDMLALRTFYSPQLRSGMSKEQVAALLPGILATLNPTGGGYVSTGQSRTPASWIDTMRGAVGPSGSNSRRSRKINEALKSSEQLGYERNRLGYVLYARGRILSKDEQEEAIRSYTRAYELYRRLYGVEDIHTARATVQLASLAIAAGETDRAQQLITPSKQAARKSQDAGLLMNLLALEAEVARLTGQSEKADILRQEAREWGLYALGKPEDVERILKITVQIGKVGRQSLKG